MDRFAVCLFAAALAHVGTARADGGHTPPCGGHDPGPKIAVVGAGAAGLTAAYLLAQRGYERVTVFEKEAELGGFARTRFVDGKAFDLATMFVPGSTMLGHGVEPVLSEMIAASGEPLVPAVDFGTLLAKDQGNVFSEVPLPVLAACGTPESVPSCKQQLIHGFALQSKFLQCLAQGIDPVRCGISDASLPNENVVQWGQRHGVPLFVQLMLYTSDGLGAAGDQSGGLPDINVMIPMAYWTPAEVYRSLRMLGATAEEIPVTLPNLQSMFAKDSQHWYFFENGYQTFWQSLVAEAGIRVELGATVTKVHPNGRARREWDVTVERSGGRGRGKSRVTRRFDIVIVTAPPAAAASLLADGSPQADLLLTAAPGGFPVRVVLAPIGHDPALVAGELPDPWAFWIKDPSIEVSPQSVPAVRPFFWQKRHADVNYAIVGSYNYQDVTLESSFETLQDYADATLGVTVGPMVDSLSVTFPSRPRNVGLWRQGWAELQGRDGLYFSGEAFFGGGVPGITAGLARLIGQHFPDRTAP